MFHRQASVVALSCNYPSSSYFPIMHIPQSWVMSCMADVHEVQEANDKSKFHRQIKNVLECKVKTGRMSLEKVGCPSIETWRPRWKGTSYASNLSYHSSSISWDSRDNTSRTWTTVDTAYINYNTDRLTDRQTDRLTDQICANSEWLRPDCDNIIFTSAPTQHNQLNIQPQIWLAIGYFLLVVLWNQASISNGFSDNQ